MNLVENKRLSKVLAYIKGQQDQHHPAEPKTNSDKNGYKPRGRKPGRRPDFMNDPDVIAKHVRALARTQAAE